MASRENHYRTAEHSAERAHNEDQCGWAQVYATIALAHAVMATVDRDVVGKAAALTAREESE